MHRSLVELLHAYMPSDAEEKVYKERMLEFIKKHANCFERSLTVGHFTGSAWLLDQDKSHVLLMHHTKLDKWMQLGGHCDGDSDVLAVALKEAQEESGINSIISVSQNIFDIDIHAIPASGNNQEHYHYDVRFLLQVNGSGAFVQNRESKELRWISTDRKELPTNSRSIVRMFDKWIAL